MIDSVQYESRNAGDLVRADRELAQLEAGLLSGARLDVAAVGALLERVRPLNDDALLGRALCLFSRTQGLQGQHEGALSSAYAGVQAVSKLDAVTAQRYAGVRAELLRAAGAALAKLGRIAQALPVLEEAVGIAQQYTAHLTIQLGVERARADAESQRRIAVMLETLGEIGQEITANLDPVAVFQIFTRHVESLLRVSAFMVWLLDAGGQRLMLAFGLEDGVALAAPDIPVDDAHSPTALAARERREIFGAAGAATTLFAPLLVADRILGVVSIQSDRHDAFSEHERLIFRTICTYAAIALDNATAYTKLEHTVRALQDAQAELGRQTAEFERLSMTDALTGVANRRHLHDRAAVEIAAVARKPGPLSVAMFDIDHFKRVNDTYGHAVGDAVLQRIAQVAKEWLRPGDLLARVGGEEFALLLPGAGIRESVAVAERIRASIAETIVVVGDANVRVTSSFGVATFDAACDTLEHALSRADRALYAAKVAGRDRVLATPSVCV